MMHHSCHCHCSYFTFSLKRGEWLSAGMGHLSWPPKAIEQTLQSPGGCTLGNKPPSSTHHEFGSSMTLGGRLELNPLQVWINKEQPLLEAVDFHISLIYVHNLPLLLPDTYMSTPTPTHLAGWRSIWPIPAVMKALVGYYLRVQEKSQNFPMQTFLSRPPINPN